MKKRSIFKLTSILTAAAMLAGSAALTANAAQTFEPSGASAPAVSGITAGAFTFDLWEDWGVKKAKITGFNEAYYAARTNKNFDKDFTVEFPSVAYDEEGESYTVTEINIGTYTNGKDSCTFKTVKIPKEVECFWQSFSEMPNIEYIVLEEGSQLEKLESYGLLNCTGLKRIGIGETDVLPETCEDVGRDCFEGCTVLESIALPECVTTIDIGTFSDCTSLKEVKWSSKLRLIEDFAFQGCTSLTELTFPATIQELQSGTFKGCTSLETVTFKAYKAGEKRGKNDLIRLGWYTNFYGGPFEDCTALTTVNLVPSAGNCFIDAYAFKNTALTGINIPETYTSIGSEAFAGTKLDSNALTTDKGEAYGIAFFRKTIDIASDAFGDVKPIVAGYDESSADTYSFDHGMGFVSLGSWTPYTFSFGDADGDGVITSTDALSILRVSMDMESFTDEQIDLCDLDEDGVITSADALHAQRIGLELD